MQYLELDLARYTTIVFEYHRQRREGMTRTSYQNACTMLQEEIGETRFQEARDEYDERQFRQAEAKEDRWIESHYR